MLRTGEMLSGYQMPYGDVPGWDWLEGALNGMSIYEQRDPSWFWSEFLDDIRLMQRVHDIKPTGLWDKTESADLRDFLGGYVSVAGSISAEGLSFPIPYGTGHIITSSLYGVRVEVSEHRVVVPWDEVDSFTTIVTLKGPVMELLLEVSS